MNYFELFSNIMAVNLLFQFLLIAIAANSRKAYFAPMVKGTQEEIFRFTHIVAVLSALVYGIFKIVETI